MFKRTLVALIMLAGAVGAAGNGSLLVLSKHDQTLSIVNPETLKVVTKIPVGADPHEVIASSDGRYAYVSDYGGGAYNTLSLADLVNGKALPAIDLGPLRGPHGLAYAGGETWFTAEVAKAIGRYNPQTQKVDWILGTGQNRTHMVWVSPDQKRIYTTNVSSGTVSIIEKVERSNMPPPQGPGARPPGPPPGRHRGAPGGDWNETVVEVGPGSEGFDISPDGKQLWTAAAGDGTVSIIDLSTKQRIAKLPAGVIGANRLKFTPDGKRVFISSLRGGITVLDAVTRQQIKRFDTQDCEGILVQPDGARVYVSITGANYVAVIDPNRLEIVGRIDAGRQPDGLAWWVRRCHPGRNRLCHLSHWGRGMDSRRDQQRYRGPARR